jgi:hypothetical protein
MLALAHHSAALQASWSVKAKTLDTSLQHFKPAHNIIITDM